MTRLPFGIAGAVLMVVLSVVSAEASACWCEEDPLLTITSPQGAAQVYLTTYAEGLNHLAAIQSEQVSYAVQPAEGGLSRVEVSIRISSPDEFRTRFVVSSGPNGSGHLFASKPGNSRSPNRVGFRIHLS